MPGPASQEPMSFAGSAGADPEAGAHDGHPHILVVDDHPVIRALVSAYLGQNDLRVTTLAEGGAMRALFGRQINARRVSFPFRRARAAVTPATVTRRQP